MNLPRSDYTALAKLTPPASCYISSEMLCQRQGECSYSSEDGQNRELRQENNPPSNPPSGHPEYNSGGVTCDEGPDRLDALPSSVQHNKPADGTTSGTTSDSSIM